MGNLIRMIFGKPRVWRRLEDIPRNVKVSSVWYPYLETVYDGFSGWMIRTDTYAFKAVDTDGPFTEVI